MFRTKFFVVLNRYTAEVTPEEDRVLIWKRITRRPYPTSVWEVEHHDEEPSFDIIKITLAYQIGWLIFCQGLQADCFLPTTARSFFNTTTRLLE